MNNYFLKTIGGLQAHGFGKPWYLQGGRKQNKINHNEVVKI